MTKRDEDSSLMQLKEEFRTYEALRREHDSQIVQIAMEGGLRIAPDQWSSLLYGDQSHKSHMQSIIDKVTEIYFSFFYAAHICFLIHKECLMNSATVCIKAHSDMRCIWSLAVDIKCQFLFPWFSCRPRHLLLRVFRN